MIKKIDKIGKVSRESVLKCTGKDWNGWVKILDAEGARILSHKEIAALLKTKFKLSPWWQQGVTLGYEIFIQRRVPGQIQKGDYSTVTTMTFQIDQKKMWKFLSSKKGLKVWLKPLDELKLKPGVKFEVYGGIYGEVRTVRLGSRVRMSWQETDWEKPTVVQLHIVPKKSNYCMVVIDHQNMKTETLKNQMRKHWKNALMEISASLK